MENTQPIIEVTDVTMRFNLAKEITDSIKEYFLKLLSGKLHFNEFFALKNITFQINRGDAVALIGKNGSGKSTMLKILAGVMYPTRGQVAVRGSVAPLIELGAGFDMELTARENVYLNGAILGHDRAFMDRHMDEIIGFSELENFVDVPLKNFSSGMVARLGFAIATVIRADILIVDEVLAVGDFRFQEKCKAKIAELDHWTDKQETRAAVDILIRDILFEEIPDSMFDHLDAYRRAIYEHVYTHYKQAVA
jgi:ABC-type polysaccharide/polyol phosphate transport system ATPase subunit